MQHEMKDNAISKVEYKLEWVDHLFEIYRDFKRRNDIGEWMMFFRRPELAIPEEYEKIAEEVFRYLTGTGNIAQKIVRYIETVFHYCDTAWKYEKLAGFEAMEVYRRYLLGAEEFPPYHLFEGDDETKDYDSYLECFRDTYFGFEAETKEECIEEYKRRLEYLRSTEIRHPYIALLESQYYVLCEEYSIALSTLQNMEDSYHKFMNMGILFTALEDYISGETCFERALSKGENQNLEPMLIRDYILCTWHTGKQAEALQLANQFAAEGYEHVVLDIKQEILEELCGLIREKGEDADLSEGECLIFKEYLLLIENYEAVIELGKMSWEKGYQSGSWTVDMAEAYFETGQYEQAKRIVDLVYDGQRSLEPEERLKIREMKAKLLFEQGRIADAYEIMQSLCRRKGGMMAQKFSLAKMYSRTGRWNDAIDILKRLRFDSPWNAQYTYELARCLHLRGQEEDIEQVCYLFIQAYQMLRESGRMPFEKLPYYIVQSAIDGGKADEAEEMLETLQEQIPECYIRYLKGQFLEANEEYDKAKDAYYRLAQDFRSEPYPKELLYDVYLRYFLMREETGGRVFSLMSEMEKVVQEYPDAADIWLILGELHENSDVKAERITMCYERALQADPYNERAMISLINRYIIESRWNQVYELSDRNVLYSGTDDAYLSRAQSALELGKISQCLKDLAEFEKRGGDKRRTKPFRGRIAMQQGDYETALSCYQELQKEKQTDEVPFYDDIALCMCKLGRFEEAESMLDIVCESSKNYIFHYRLYQIQMHCGKFKELKYTLKRMRKMCGLGHAVVDDFYGSLQTSFLLESGNLLLAEGLSQTITSSEGEELNGIIELLERNYIGATRIFKKLAEKYTDEIDHYSWTALTLHLRGKHEERMQWAEKGLAVFRKNYGEAADNLRPDLLCQYGFLKAMHGEFQEARDAFRKALEIPACSESICSECYEAWYGLGVCCAVEGRPDQAYKAFENSLKIKPCNKVCRTMMKRLT